MAVLKTLPSSLLDYLFPRRCVGCAADGEWACEHCVSRVKVGLECFSGGVALFPFEERLVHELLHAVKYESVHDGAATLVGMAARHYSAGEVRELLNLHGEAAVLVPVPASHARVKVRGYNQAALFARELGAWLELPVWLEALARQNSLSQVGRSARERQDILQGAFTWREDVEYVRYRTHRWVVVDDTATTGATLAACCAALAPHASQPVTGLVMARAH